MLSADDVGHTDKLVQIDINCSHRITQMCIHNLISISRLSHLKTPMPCGMERKLQEFYVVTS